jgi:hypothetical protein
MADQLPGPSGYLRSSRTQRRDEEDSESTSSGDTEDLDHAYEAGEEVLAVQKAAEVEEGERRERKKYPCMICVPALVFTRPWSLIDHMLNHVVPEEGQTLRLSQTRTACSRCGQSKDNKHKSELKGHSPCSPKTWRFQTFQYHISLDDLKASLLGMQGIAGCAVDDGVQRRRVARAEAAAKTDKAKKRKRKGKK